MFSQGHQTGPSSLAVRPMNEAERQAALNSLMPARYNAIAMSLLGIVTSVMVNYAHDVIVVVVPLMFIARRSTPSRPTRRA